MFKDDHREFIMKMNIDEFLLTMAMTKTGYYKNAEAVNARLI